MLIYLSILPVYLLLVYGVTSAELSKNKQVLRRHTKVTRSYNFNHPPAVETDDHIPVAVVYDDEEVINDRNKIVKKADVIIEDETNHGAIGGTARNLENPSVNHPSSSNDQPVAVVNDYEKELNLKARARSINIPVTKSKESKAPKITSAESKTRTDNKTRRRTLQIGKIKVDKSQLESNVNDTEFTDNKEAQKKSTTITDQTLVNKQSVPIPKTFERRKQSRDPIIPIISAESYVYSHSGNFHHSYEGGDGTKAYERGELKSLESGAGNAVEGNYSYTDKDGNDFSLTYTADENGYRPVGKHLPTAPPIPPAIQRALDYLATKSTPEPITERTRKL